jgi:hypothetical protein
MQLPVRTTDSSSLELRRRAIRARHRRAMLREFAGMALWALGLCAVGVLAVAIVVGSTAR